MHLREAGKPPQRVFWFPLVAAAVSACTGIGLKVLSAAVVKIWIRVGVNTRTEAGARCVRHRLSDPLRVQLVCRGGVSGTLQVPLCVYSSETWRLSAQNLGEGMS